MAEGPVASRTGEFAELKWQLDAADADIVLLNKVFDSYFCIVNRSSLEHK